MNPDFLDLLCALLAADARFMVVGAYAVGVHGRPRATKDLDVWVEPSVANARVIGLEALLANKRAAGRPQDLADVHALEKLRAVRTGGQALEHERAQRRTHARGRVLIERAGAD
jgi:hypothetical protein